MNLRRVAAVVAVLAVFGVGSYLLAPPEPDSSTEQIRSILPVISPESPGLYLTAGLHSLDTVAWSKPNGGSLLRPPLPYDGKLLVFEKLGEGIIRMSAVDPTKGVTIWNAEISGAEIAEPTLANGIAYISASDGEQGSWPGSLGTRLVAVDVSNGKVAWIIDQKHLLTQPQLSESNIVVGTADGDLLAFNRKSGGEAWSVDWDGAHSSGATPDRISISAPVIHQETVARTMSSWAGSDSIEATSDITAFDAESGEELWLSSLSGQASSTIAGRSGQLYVGVEVGEPAWGGARHVFGRMYALSADEGSQLWATDYNSTPSNKPLVSNEAIYFQTSAPGIGYAGHPGTLVGLGLATGDTLFEFNPYVRGDRGGGRIDSFLMLGDALVVTSSNWGWFNKSGAVLYSADPISGELNWKTVLDGSVPGPITATDGLIYVGDGEWAKASTLPDLPADQTWAEGSLRGIEAESGNILWSHPLALQENAVPPTPVIYNSRVFFSDLDSNLTALK